MKAVILSRGRGIHLLQGKGLISKALIPINGIPLIYYILKHFYFYGIDKVILCVDSNCEEDIRKLLTKSNKDLHFNRLLEKIKPYIINTGKNNKTGSMLLGVRKLLEDGEFIITYNDIITDINLSQLIQYHKTKRKILTAIGVHPTVRQGVIQQENGIITKYSFDEPVDTIIKGGYFLAKPKFFKYLTNDCFFEEEPFQKLISDRQAAVFDYRGFWKQVDSWRDLEELEKLFKKGHVTWMIK